MSQERKKSPGPKRPYEVFGLIRNEALHWRVGKDRFEALLNGDQTLIHKINASSNTFGEFLCVTTSRPGEKDRIYLTFYDCVIMTIENVGSLKSGTGTLHKSKSMQVQRTL